MKKLLLTMTLMTLMTQAFAGILENRATGETLEFNLDRMTREVQILSTANNVENKVIKMKSLRKNTSDIRMYGATHDLCVRLHSWNDNLDFGEVAFCFIVPLVNIPGIIFGTVETIALPFKASIKLIKTMKYNKDFKKLMKAINSTNQTRVSNKRFRRIETLLSQL